MKIGIFGGNFNPIHKGHIRMAKYIRENYNLDEIWFIPTNHSPEKKFAIEKVSPKIRYEIVKKTIKKHNDPTLKVKRYEFKLRGTSYTYKTIKYLKKRFPKHNFFLIVGDDHLTSITSWKNFLYIEANVKFIFVRREEQEQSNPRNFEYAKEFYYPVSSSEILHHARWNELDEFTKPFIAKYYLYIKSLVYFQLNHESKNKKHNKYVHSLSVANHAKKLAKKYNFGNVEKAYYAGLAHDLFKDANEAMMAKYVSHNSEWNLPPAKALHGYYAALWFQNEYLINDKEFIHAIKRHTLADFNMTKLDKIIFLADKISDDRKDPDAKRLRKLAYNNLDLAYKDALTILIKKLEEQNLKPAEETYGALENITKELSSFKPKKEKTKSTKEDNI